MPQPFEGFTVSGAGDCPPASPEPSRQGGVQLCHAGASPPPAEESMKTPPLTLLAGSRPSAAPEFSPPCRFARPVWF